ncbi:DNA-binding CsgD family transcriptional regulator [Diaminobutyricimonas aerilata]|uniref:DNA-binding CsgD family transcriptional regulator n=1 Tax=Diaminobutyricimonas aerilata TaxID=1162967 RepID=A0A2M9CM43_9MICO|nr:helix-turn-helix domain-containing protein [Diaminobutyricimonas aerilata]PJJ72964.1 DNA-binding CsgD family transcriptional regulator [Diaminobutyricimonas aerilata]
MTLALHHLPERTDTPSPWTAEEAVLVVTRAGSVVQVTDAARRMLAGRGLTADARLTGPLLETIGGVWARAGRFPGDPVAPVRAHLPGGIVGRAVVVRGDRGVRHAVITLSRSRAHGAVSTLAATHGLTARETDVVMQVLTGAPTKRIAADLRLSAYTVQDHLKAVFAKIGVGSRAQLVALVLDRLDLTD